MPVRWGLLHNEDSNFALIATEIGVWQTSNLLSEEISWIPSSNGLANVRVDMLSIRDIDNMVLAASHGRGLFYGEFQTTTTQMGDINNDNNIDILDIVIIIYMILSVVPYNPLADINVDQSIDVLDIVLFVNIILDS